MQQRCCGSILQRENQQSNQQNNRQSNHQNNQQNDQQNQQNNQLCNRGVVAVSCKERDHAILKLVIGKDTRCLHPYSVMIQKQHEAYKT